jgi:hypothetical protein
VLATPSMITNFGDRAPWWGSSPPRKGSWSRILFAHLRSLLAFKELFSEL